MKYSKNACIIHFWNFSFKSLIKCRKFYSVETFDFSNNEVYWIFKIKNLCSAWDAFFFAKWLFHGQVPPVGEKSLKIDFKKCRVETEASENAWVLVGRWFWAKIADLTENRYFDRSLPIVVSWASLDLTFYPQFRSAVETDEFY